MTTECPGVKTIIDKYRNILLSLYMGPWMLAYRPLFSLETGVGKKMFPKIA